MLRRSALLVGVGVSLVASAPIAFAQERAPRESTSAQASGTPGAPEDGSDFVVELRAALRAGAMLGHTVWHANAALIEGEARVRPSLTSGAYRLRVPVELSHSQTIGASMPELRASVGAEGRYRASPRFRAELELGLLGTWRPGWPDLYQPLTTGGVAPTDRYSYLQFHVGGAIAAIPIRHHHARVAYEYAIADYDDDNAFNAIDAPTHLVPSDHDEHQLELGWHYFGDGWRAGGGVEVVRSGWFSTFARDAGTGATHAGAGGPPPNPLRVTWSIEPSVDAQVELADERTTLEGSYGLEVDVDEWQGYYSYVGQHPGLEVKWKATRDLRVALDAELSWRTYGAGSYAAGPGHPPLESGERRWDRRLEVDLDARYRLGSGFALTLEAGWEHRRTNFPNYVPGVYPAGRQYDIRWDWDDVRVLAGVEFSLEAGDDDDD